VGTRVAVDVGEAVAVPDGLGVNVGRGEGVRDEVEVNVGLAAGVREGDIVVEIGEEVACGWLERVRSKMAMIRMTMITPNPPNRSRKNGDRSD
jgi:hypothetical protein